VFLKPGFARGCQGFRETKTRNGEEFFFFISGPEFVDRN